MTISWPLAPNSMHVTLRGEFETTAGFLRFRALGGDANGVPVLEMDGAACTLPSVATGAPFVRASQISTFPSLAPDAKRWAWSGTWRTHLTLIWWPLSVKTDLWDSTSQPLTKRSPEAVTSCLSSCVQITSKTALRCASHRRRTGSTDTTSIISHAHTL